jgi:hypothetical protein
MYSNLQSCTISIRSLPKLQRTQKQIHIMPVTAGPIYPGIKDGLVFAIDPANKDSWVGPTSDTVNNLPTYNSSITGSISYDTSGSYGDNNSFAFDGVDDRINLTNNIPSLTYGTISMWFKIPSNTTNITQALFNIYEGTSNRFVLSIGEATGAYSNESLMAFFWNGGSTSNISYAPVTRQGHTYYFDDTWHNIVLTIDSGDAPRTKIYIDTVSRSLSYPFGSNTGVGFTNLSPISVTIGCRFYNGSFGNFFDGSIGPILIYNRALSAPEVLQNYNRLKGRFNL